MTRPLLLMVSVLVGGCSRTPVEPTLIVIHGALASGENKAAFIISCDPVTQDIKICSDSTTIQISAMGWNKESKEVLWTSSKLHVQNQKEP